MGGGVPGHSPPLRLFYLFRYTLFRLKTSVTNAHLENRLLFVCVHIIGFYDYKKKTKTLYNTKYLNCTVEEKIYFFIIFLKFFVSPDPLKFLR